MRTSMDGGRAVVGVLGLRDFATWLGVPDLAVLQAIEDRRLTFHNGLCQCEDGSLGVCVGKFSAALPKPRVRKRSRKNYRNN